MAAMIYLLAPEAAAFSHGDNAIDEDVVGIVDNAVHDNIGDRAGLLRIRGEALMPLASVVLGKKIVAP